MNGCGLRRDGKELQDGAFGAASGGQVAEVAVAAVASPAQASALLNAVTQTHGQR